MSTAGKFYAHFADCDTCFTDHETAKLCAIGEELMFEAEDDLDDGWKCIAGVIRRKAQLEREAEANSKYYEGDSEI